MIKFEALTGLRGYAALYVVVYHLVHLPFLINFKTNGYVAVDLFFILSGFLLVHNYKQLFEQGNYKEGAILFFNHRFARIYPVYFFWLFVSFVIGTCQYDTYSVLQILSNLTITQIFFHYKSIVLPAWSVSVEWGLYLFFPIFFALMKSAFYRTVLVILCLIIYIVLINRLIPELMGTQNRANGSLDIFFYDAYATVLRGLAGFLTGMCSYSVLRKLQTLEKRSLSVALYCVVLVILILLNFKGYDLFVVYFFVLLILLCAICDNGITKLLSNSFAIFLGNISYSLYLSHLLLFPLISVIFDNQYLKVAVIVAISYLSFFLIEKPLTKKLRYKH